MTENDFCCRWIWLIVSLGQSQTAKVICNNSHSQQNDLKSFSENEFFWWRLIWLVFSLSLSQSHLQQQSFSAEWCRMTSLVRDEFGGCSLSAQVKEQIHLQQKSFCWDLSFSSMKVNDFCCRWIWLIFSLGQSQTAKVIYNNSHSQLSDREWLLLLEKNLADVLSQPKSDSQSHLQQTPFSAEWQRMNSFVGD